MENYEKTCRKCKEVKNITNFAFKSRVKNTHQGMCKSCQKLESDAWYLKNKSKHKANVRLNNAIYIDENRNYVYDYLLSNPCVDCGENNPVVLDFDHMLNKSFNISGSYKNYSLSTIKKEIDKCEVRCANCHRVKTAKQLGWYLWRKSGV